MEKLHVELKYFGTNGDAARLKQQTCLIVYFGLFDFCRTLHVICCAIFYGMHVLDEIHIKIATAAADLGSRSATLQPTSTTLYRIREFIAKYRNYIPGLFHFLVFI